MEVVSEKNPIKKSKLIGKIVNGVLTSLIVLIMGVQIYGQVSASRNRGVISYGNFSSFRVLTDSMEPIYPVGTMVYTKKVDPSTLKARSSETAKDGDAITFWKKHTLNYQTISGDPIVVTHRIIKIEEHDGQLAFWTLGDNLNSKESCPINACTDANHDWVLAEDIIGVVIGQSKMIGQINLFFSKNPVAIFGLVLVPLALVFGSSLKDLFKQLKEKEQLEGEVKGIEMSDSEVAFEVMKEQEKMKIMIEIEKEKMRKEMMEEKSDEKKE